MGWGPFQERIRVSSEHELGSLLGMGLGPPMLGLGSLKAQVRVTSGHRLKSPLGMGWDPLPSISLESPPKHRLRFSLSMDLGPFCTWAGFLFGHRLGSLSSYSFGSSSSCWLGSSFRYGFGVPV